MACGKFLGELGERAKELGIMGGAVTCVPFDAVSCQQVNRNTYMYIYMYTYCIYIIVLLLQFLRLFFFNIFVKLRMFLF